MPVNAHFRFLSRGFQSLVLIALGLGVFSSAARAELKVHALFSDHMVLQQGTSAPVWGWANDGEVVTVKFRDQSVSATAKGGKWMVRLKKLKPGGPDTLTISTASKTVTCSDVLVGEVWVCSGQSNMEWPLKQSFEPAADIAGSKNPMVRLFTVPRLKADAPVDDITNPNGWNAAPRQRRVSRPWAIISGANCRSASACPLV